MAASLDFRPRRLRALWWDGPDPAPGHVLLTARGTAYLIDVVQRKTTFPFRLTVVRIDPAQLPPGAVVHPWRWAPARRRRWPRPR